MSEKINKMGRWKTPEELQEFMTSYQRNIKYKEIGSMERNRTFVQSLDDDEFNYPSIYKALVNFDSQGLSTLLIKKGKYSLVTLLAEWLQCSDGRYGCPPCQYVYTSRVNLVRHLIDNHFNMTTKKTKKVSPESERSCQICFVTLSSKHVLQSHKRIHEGRKDFKCVHCHKTFYSKKALVTHVNIHTQKRGFPCPFCGRMFYSSSGRRGHIITSHQETKPFKCDICDMTFAQNRKLTRHRLTHFPASFQCLECQKMFRFKGSLQNHSKSHKSEEERINYKCNFCHKMFVTKVALNQHISCHTGERPHECAFCGDRFRRPHHLAQHLTKHTQEKHYPCGTCDKAFGLKQQLDKHLKTHAGS